MLQLIIQPSMFDVTKFNFEALDENNKTFCFNTECENVEFQKEITIKNYIKSKSEALVKIRKQNYLYAGIKEETANTLASCKEQLKKLKTIPHPQFKTEACKMVEMLNTIKPEPTSNFYNYFIKVQKSILDTINKYL